MPSLWKALSRTSSSDDNDRSLKDKSKSSSHVFKNTANNEQTRKLSRVRKLRHVTEDELGLKSKSSGADAGARSCPVSPDSGSGRGAGARTPRGTCGGHWSKTAVPQPLPRPELNYQLTQNDRKNVYPTCHRRGLFPQELNVDNANNDFHLHFPTRSAPSSGLSSPVLSPQRYSTVDLFRPLFHVPSSLNSSNSDRICKSHQISPEHSPLHSPTIQSPTKHGNSRNCDGVLLHSHNKSPPESFVLRNETNNGNVHPLPLPPAVGRPSPTVRHSFDKSDVLSVKGQWQRGRPIGRGTYGNVYIATHRETGATCAVKEVEMIPDDPKCAECVKQLEQEIKFLRELKHRNIVQYYGCEIIEDRFCIYLEYVHPGSVNKYVREHCGAMTESIVRNFTRHILSGLAYLHSTSTIHRNISANIILVGKILMVVTNKELTDIKGANLLVDASGVVKLADFGLAKHLNGHDIDLSLKGTPQWMAPEVLQAVMRKDANLDLAYGVDIWSVGCTVIEMLTGKPPWSELTWVQAMFSVLNKSPPIPETLSAEGKDFLRRCFQRRPEDRPSAVKLLEHPFVRSSQDVVQEFSGMKLHDVESTSDWTRRNKDVMLVSSVTRIQQGKLPLLKGETSRRSCPESSDSGSTSHNSPRSTLEALPRVFPPEINRCSNNTSASNVVNNNFYNFSCKGNITLLMTKMAEIE